MSKTKITLCAIILFGILFPSAALAIYKPTRVIVPSFFGVQCFDDGVCVDEISQLHKARLLKSDAVAYVNRQVGMLKHIPRIIFCSGKVCQNRFGMYHAAAYNVGTVGIVIRNKGWEPHFVRHELIHHLQNERLGSIANFLFKPEWFLEGMAYSLSGDPRRPIPNDELEAFRRKFETWNSNEDIWQRAEKL